MRMPPIRAGLDVCGELLLPWLLAVSACPSLKDLGGMLFAGILIVIANHTLPCRPLSKSS